ncbi:MAG: ATP-binding protein [Deltaproteobacteria bacterium]|nr:ATP-binding protein [Deltaproteobacteria bacterium]MBW2123588.1 ATP-binding protein [Deltaproteobacteria bacterium]
MDRGFSEAIASEVPENALLISTGLPGSWKSPVTERISEIKGASILRSDMIRLEVLRGLDIFDEKVASNRENRMKVYEEMFRQAEERLNRNPGGLILDATFVTQDLRIRAAGIAHRTARPLVIAEMRCSEEASIRRILKRTKENYESNALTRQAYLNNKAIFQEVDLGEIKKHFSSVDLIYLLIDTEYDEPERWEVRRVERR